MAGALGGMQGWRREVNFAGVQSLEAGAPVFQNNKGDVPAGVAGQLFQLVRDVTGNLAVFDPCKLRYGVQPHAHGALRRGMPRLDGKNGQAQKYRTEQDCNGANVPVAHVLYTYACISLV